MNGINRVILLGRLGASPELKHTASGKAFCRVGLATNHSVKQGDEWREYTEWHSLVAWDHQAELVCRHLSKGSPCLVEGRLSSHSYEDSAGVRRRSVDVVADRVVFLSAANGRKSERDERSPVSDPGDSVIPDEPEDPRIAAASLRPPMLEEQPAY